MIIGVFDSGIGGEAMATKLRKLLPEAEVICINDHDHMPYGTRPESQIIDLTITAIQPLLKMNCDAIIIACNTATTVAIRTLREHYPAVLFIGIEPMIKPAARLTTTGRIAVCATPSTIHSARYQELKATWATGIEIIEPDCSSWASAIENDKSNTLDIESVVASLVNQNVDVIVLACTHYHWIKQRIIDVAGPKVTVLEPSDAIAKRITSLIS